MELHIQIRKYRKALGLSQEQLAEKVYVSRQTVSNWENGKNCPDLQSLLLLASLFQVSLDALVKGEDLEKMKEIFDEQEIRQLKKLSRIFTVLLAALIVLPVPLFVWLKQAALISLSIVFAAEMVWALKIEKIKSDQDVQTYREITAFFQGRRLDEKEQLKEEGKRPYQKILLAAASAAIAFCVCVLVGWVLDLFRI